MMTKSHLIRLSTCRLGTKCPFIATACLSHVPKSRYAPYLLRRQSFTNAINIICLTNQPTIHLTNKKDHWTKSKWSFEMTKSHFIRLSTCQLGTKCPFIATMSPLTRKIRQIRPIGLIRQILNRKSPDKLGFKRLYTVHRILDKKNAGCAESSLVPRCAYLYSPPSL